MEGLEKGLAMGRDLLLVLALLLWIFIGLFVVEGLWSYAQTRGTIPLVCEENDRRPQCL